MLKMEVDCGFSITLKDRARAIKPLIRPKCDYTIKIHMLVALAYLTLTILIFGSIIYALAQNTTSSAFRSAVPQVAT
jgi:hypothetical protein